MDTRFQRQKEKTNAILDYNAKFLSDFKKPIDHNEELRVNRKRKREEDKNYSLEAFETYKKTSTRGKKKRKVLANDFINYKNKLYNEKLQKHFDKV